MIRIFLIKEKKSNTIYLVKEKDIFAYSIVYTLCGPFPFKFKKEITLPVLEYLLDRLMKLELHPWERPKNQFTKKQLTNPEILDAFRFSEKKFNIIDYVLSD